MKRAAGGRSVKSFQLISASIYHPHSQLYLNEYQQGCWWQSFMIARASYHDDRTVRTVSSNPPHKLCVFQSPKNCRKSLHTHIYIQYRQNAKEELLHFIGVKHLLKPYTHTHIRSCHKQVSNSNPPDKQLNPVRNHFLVYMFFLFWYSSPSCLGILCI